MCNKAHNAAASAAEEESVLWVPARLLLCASKDADMQQHLTESVFKNGLFPAKLPMATAAKHWAAIYMSSNPQVDYHLQLSFWTSS